jgi:AcrR family transcriptional regulator
MKENQRVRLTKRMLRESLIRLMAERSIHKISVREICSEAQINRTTFYKYYGSQYDLLKDMETEVLSQIDSVLGASEDRPKSDLQLLTKIAAYMNDNIDLCRLLINNAVDSEFPEKLLSLPKIQRLLSAQLEAKYDCGELGYIDQFVINGGFSMIKSWINKDNREPPEVIAAILVNVLSRIFP